MLGHMTYLSAMSVADKFGRRLQFADDIRYVLTEPEFEVENYLRRQAETFVKRFDANTYLYTSGRCLTLTWPGSTGRRPRVRPPARLRPDAPHRVQLGLALSAEGLRGAGRRAPGRRRRRRAARHRRPRRARLLPARGGAPDTDDPGVPRAPGVTFMEESRDFGFETRQVHAGQRPDPNTGARAVPIYQTTSYVFEDPESAAAYFNLQEYGNTYSRIMNPTVAVLEERMGEPGGGCGTVAFASGIAAQAAALFTLLAPGDHVVSSSALYGGSVNQLKHLLRKMSVELTWVDPDDLEAWNAAVRDNTKAFYGETIGNPGGNVLDIEAIATIAHAHDLPLIVDNTFATPFLCRPVEWGADIVPALGHEVHRGAWHQYRRNRGRVRAVQLVERPLPRRCRTVARVSRAPVPRDLRELRVSDEAARRDTPRPRRRHEPVQCVPVPSGAGDAVAPHGAARGERRRRGDYLQSHDMATNVTYPGLLTSRYRPLVDKYLPQGAELCSRSTATVAARQGRTSSAPSPSGRTLPTWAMRRALSSSPRARPTGSSTTMSCGPPASRPGTIRLSVGIEDIDDLIWDLERGFARVAASVGSEVALR